MYKIWVSEHFGGGYYYDEAFDTYSEAEAFIIGIGAKYVEEPSVESSADWICYWYDEFWDIVYEIEEA